MENRFKPIVIVDDDRHFASLVEYELEMNGYSNVRVCTEPQQFLNSLNEEPYLVILDFQFDDTTGLDVLREIKTFNPNIHVIMLSGQEHIANAVSTLKYGAFDYVEKNQDAFGRILSLINHLALVDQEISQAQGRNTRTRLLSRIGLAALAGVLPATLSSLI